MTNTEAYFFFYYVKRRMDIEQAFTKYVAQRNWRKLCMISKYYLQHLEIKKNGYFILPLAFAYTSKKCRRFNDKIMMLARSYGFHCNSVLSSNRDQSLMSVMKNTVDRAFEREVLKFVDLYKIQKMYDF